MQLTRETRRLDRNQTPCLPGTSTGSRFLSSWVVWVRVGDLRYYYWEEPVEEDSHCEYCVPCLLKKPKPLFGWTETFLVLWFVPL